MNAQFLISIGAVQQKANKSTDSSKYDNHIFFLHQGSYCIYCIIFLLVNFDKTFLQITKRTVNRCILEFFSNVSQRHIVQLLSIMSQFLHFKKKKKRDQFHVKSFLSCISTTISRYENIYTNGSYYLKPFSYNTSGTSQNVMAAS